MLEVSLRRMAFSCLALTRQLDATPFRSQSFSRTMRNRSTIATVALLLRVVAAMPGLMVQVSTRASLAVLGLREALNLAGAT